MKRILSIVVLTLLVGFSALSMFTMYPARLGTSSKYREIIIDNSGNPETLIGYQVLLNVTYDSDMQPDFDDLRFTWYNEESAREVNIDYWVDKYVDSEYALVWVEVPSIRGLEQEKLYMDYGDPSAVSGSNGKETFVFFDDFSTDTTSNYDFVRGPTGTINWNSIEGLLELIDNEPGEIQAGRGSYIWIRQKNSLIDTTENKYWIETRGQISGTPVPDMFSLFQFYDYTGDHSTTDIYHILMAALREGIPAGRHFDLVSDWSTREFDVWRFKSWQKETWYRWSLGTAPNGTVYSKFWTDSYSLIEELTETTVHQNTSWWPGVGHAATVSVGLTSRYDYIRVRYFTDPEPVYSISDEKQRGEQLPFWMEWWFWVITALVLITGVFAFSTIRYLKKTRTIKEPNKATSAKPTPHEKYKVCPKCGTQLPEDAVFCGKCGTKLR